MIKEGNSAQGEPLVKIPDVTYTQPDPANAYAKAGAAFQGAAWVHDAAYRQSDEVRAAAANLAEQHRLDNTVTANDIAGIIASVKAKCMAQGVPLAEMDKIVAHINGNVGAPKSQLDDIKQAAFAEAAQAAATANDDRTQNVMFAQQKIEELRAQIQVLEKDINETLRKAHERGDISDEQYNALQRTSESIDALPEGPEKDAAIAKLAKQQGQALHGARDKATREGHTENANEYGEGEGKTVKVQQTTQKTLQLQQNLDAFSPEPTTKAEHNEGKNNLPVADVANGQPVSPMATAAVAASEKAQGRGTAF